MKVIDIDEKIEALEEELALLVDNGASYEETEDIEDELRKIYKIKERIEEEWRFEYMVAEIEAGEGRKLTEEEIEELYLEWLGVKK